jgi:hypothetical protein
MNERKMPSGKNILGQFRKKGELEGERRDGWMM